VRIRGYVGKLPAPADWTQAADIAKNLMSAQFPGLGSEDWQIFARATWKESGGRLALDYDGALMKTLEAIDLETPLPALWFLFEGLKNVPVLALRGANSDILSAETLETMAKAHPKLEAVTIPDQGHAPLLHRRDAIQMIKRFVARLDDKPAPPATKVEGAGSSPASSAL
jgi:pimeloyl-ACP methyl ester carboxylesterase